MFQYTSETIINSNVGNFPINGSKVRFAALKADGTAAGAGEGEQILIDGVGLYHKDNITAAYKNAYVAATKDKLTINLSDVVTAVATEGKIVRLKVGLQQEGLVSSIYADTKLKHIKPFFYEIKVAAAATAADIADAFVAIISKEMSWTDFKVFFKASNVANALVLEADDVYARFAEFSIGSVPIAVANQSNLGNILTGVDDYDPILEWKRVEGTTAKVTLVKGSEGAGTVARLIKNLRVPTDANTDPFGADNGGKPIPGGQYTQYTIEYCTDRRHIGGQVMGALDKSITTHVFFVESGAVTAFETEFVTNLGITFTNAKANVSNGTTTAKTPKIGSKE